MTFQRGKKSPLSSRTELFQEKKKEREGGGEREERAERRVTRTPHRGFSITMARDRI